MENTIYQKLDLKTYNKRINEIEHDYRLHELGIKKNVYLSEYCYPINEYVIGNGKKDLFIVGGTHGSEIISVDFVLQLLKNLPNLKDYDPNLITLHVIPLQNPEGFDISTNTFSDISDEDFNKESYDYYLRYRTDNLINRFFGEVNNNFKKLEGKKITPSVFLDTIKQSFKSNAWKQLCDSRAIPKLKELEKFIFSLDEYDNYSILMQDIRLGLMNLEHAYKDELFFKSTIKRFSETLFGDELWQKIKDNVLVEIDQNSGTRLHQEKFQDKKIQSSVNPLLANNIEQRFIQLDIPKGSHIKFDPNGDFINLNLNAPNNQGNEILKNNKKVYGNEPSNNILAYVDGPIGKSTIDPDNFTFANENMILMQIMNSSIVQNRFLGSLLYHGTGGVIYSKPMHTKENDSKYSELKEYNDLLTEAYYHKTGYGQVSGATDTGFGDMYRNLVPGILLVELSKMGGNPIAPYGDISNIDRVIQTNLEAVNEVFKVLNERIINKNEILRR